MAEPVVVDARDAGEELAEEVPRLVLAHVPAAVVQVVQYVEAADQFPDEYEHALPFLHHVEQVHHVGVLPLLAGLGDLPRVVDLAPDALQRDRDGALGRDVHHLWDGFGAGHFFSLRTAVRERGERRGG